MKRVVVFGRGGAGKSTFSRHLGSITGLPVIELDKIYWDQNLRVLTPDEWTERQLPVVQKDTWIIDGDLGPYDVTAHRLARADTVIFIDTSLFTCVWRALRRSRQRLDFWEWVVNWRRKYRPQILGDIQKNAPTAQVVILRNRKDIENWLVSSALDPQ